MRIPVSKIYRAFPELDRFSDRECEIFIERVRKTEKFKAVSWWVALGVAIGVVVCALVQCAVTGLAYRWMEGRLARSVGTNVLLGLSMFMWFSLPTICGLLGRDRFLWKELRHAIWRRIERVRCAQCRYSLLGQRLRGGRIICPECGQSTTLAALGLASEADLIPPDADSSEAQTTIDH